MPFVLLLIAMLGVAAAVAVAYWEKCLEWAEASLFPWVHGNFPSLEETVRSAFARLNRVAVRVRRAWLELRRYLLKQTLDLISVTANTWTRRITSYLVKLSPIGNTVVQRAEEHEVAFEDLPEDVQEELLRTGKKSLVIDVTKTRDAEVSEMAH